MAAIFTAGADASYRERNHTQWWNDDNNDSTVACLKDVSTNQGQYVATLCPAHPRHTQFQWLDSSEGPYRGTGGLQLRGDGLVGTVSSSAFQEGLTVSFWARNIASGINLVHIPGILSVRVAAAKLPTTTTTTTHGSRQTRLELIRLDKESGNNWSSSSSNSSLNATTCSSSNDTTVVVAWDNPYPTEDWFWFSLQLDPTWSAQMSVFSLKGDLLARGCVTLSRHDGDTTETNTTTLDNKKKKKPILRTIELFRPFEQQPSSPSSSQPVAFVVPAAAGTTAFATVPSRSLPEMMGQVSFLVIHKAVIDDAQALRRQIGRYNIAL